MFKNKYHGSLKAINDAVTSLARMAEFGVAGSARYAPDAAQATWQGDLLEEGDPDNPEAKPAVYEALGSYTLSHVAASAMSHWICGFFEPAFITMELEILAGEMRFALTTETYSKQYYLLACAERDHLERTRDALERFKIRESQQAASGENKTLSNN